MTTNNQWLPGKFAMSLDIFSSHRQEAGVSIDTKRAAVVVVDMINDFCKPGGAMVLPGYEMLVGPQLAVIEAARLRRSGHLGARRSSRQRAPGS